MLGEWEMWRNQKGQTGSFSQGDEKTRSTAEKEEGEEEEKISYWLQKECWINICSEEIQLDAKRVDGEDRVDVVDGVNGVDDVDDVDGLDGVDYVDSVDNVDGVDNVVDDVDGWMVKMVWIV